MYHRRAVLDNTSNTQFVYDAKNMTSLRTSQKVLEPTQGRASQFTVFIRLKARCV